MRRPFRLAADRRGTGGDGAERHQPRKRFGQNFLVDRHYIERIVAAIAPRPEDNMVEIGPGLGALTRELARRVRRLTLIEIDRDLAARLQTELGDGVSLHVEDALGFDFASLGPGLRVIGNLPYNISSPLLFHLAEHAEAIADITVMLQKEVVQRMAAEPDTPAYGRLSVMLQVRFRVERLLLVPAGAFQPAPKVESAVVRLTPLVAPPVVTDARLFAQLVAAAFGQRRKTLRNALSAWTTGPAMQAQGIDPGARGETLGVADFVRLANALAEHRPR